MHPDGPQTAGYQGPSLRPLDIVVLPYMQDVFCLYGFALVLQLCIFIVWMAAGRVFQPSTGTIVRRLLDTVVHAAPPGLPACWLVAGAASRRSIAVLLSYLSLSLCCSLLSCVRRALDTAVHAGLPGLLLMLLHAGQQSPWSPPPESISI